MQQQESVFDTVGITQRMPDHASFPEGWSRIVVDKSTGQRFTRLVSTQATVRADVPVKVVNSYGRNLLKFESSVPRVLGKPAAQLATADEVRSVVSAVVREALELLEVARGDDRGHRRARFLDDHSLASSGHAVE